MIKHRYPADLDDETTATIDQIVTEMRGYLEQRAIAIVNWQRQAKEWEAQCKALRAELDHARTETAAAYAAHRLAERRVLELQAADHHREALAAYAHEAWSGWMQYLFKQGTTQADGSFTIQSWAVERWQRQMNTPYAELPESEKKSDRKEADEILHILFPDRCPRCGAILDNIGRGISIVAGGVRICTACLGPGEVEIARARSIE